MAAKEPRQVKGRDVLPGDHLQLDDGTFAKVAQVVKAPIRIENEDGTTEQPLWAYFADGSHGTMRRGDDVWVR